MLDYYFCEECQTYHQPNRIINGQILSACQCQISTQTATDSSSNPNSRFHVAESAKTDVGTNVQSTIEDSPMLRLRYQTPLKQTNIKNQNLASIPHTTSKYQNMPFMSIINQENRQKLTKIQNQRPQIHIQPRNTRFLSPNSIRQDVALKKSVSPPTRTIRKSLIKSPPKSIISVPKVQTKTLLPKPLQSITSISSATPVQTITKLLKTQPLISMPSLVSIQTIQQNPIHTYSRPQILILNKPLPTVNQVLSPTRPLSPQIKIINQKIEARTKSFPEYNRISLDRVSAQNNNAQEMVYSQYQNVNNNNNKRVTLDRVSGNNYAQQYQYPNNINLNTNRVSNNNQLQNNTNRFTLDRVSRDKAIQTPDFLQQFQVQNKNINFNQINQMNQINQISQMKQNRFSLDRIAQQQPNSKGQYQQIDKQCCGKACYY